MLRRRSLELVMFGWPMERTGIRLVVARAFMGIMGARGTGWDNQEYTPGIVMDNVKGTI